MASNWIQKRTQTHQQCEHTYSTIPADINSHSCLVNKSCHPLTTYGSPFQTLTLNFVLPLTGMIFCVLCLDKPNLQWPLLYWFPLFFFIEAMSLLWAHTMNLLTPESSVLSSRHFHCEFTLVAHTNRSLTLATWDSAFLFSCSEICNSAIRFS